MPPVDAVDVCPDRLRVSSSCHAANLSVSAAQSSESDQPFHTQRDRRFRSESPNDRGA